MGFQRLWVGGGKKIRAQKVDGNFEKILFSLLQYLGLLNQKANTREAYVISCPQKVAKTDLKSAILGF